MFNSKLSVSRAQTALARGDRTAARAFLQAAYNFSRNDIIDEIAEGSHLAHPDDQRGRAGFVVERGINVPSRLEDFDPEAYREHHPEAVATIEALLILLAEARHG